MEPALAALQGTLFPEALAAICGLFGLVIGSFLNAAIYRLPRPELTLSKPRRSACPACDRSLTWRENVPLLSWLLQLGRCRGCGWRIPLRYPLVEALTAGLFIFAAQSTPPADLALLAVRLLALAGLIVATFVDLDFFEIPDEVSLGGMALGPLVCLAVPALHAESWIAINMTPVGESVGPLAALTAGLAGLVVGGGGLYLMGRAGSAAFGQEAMGFGDVKLIAAAGLWLGPGGVLVALMLASLVASFFGIGNILRFFCLLRRRCASRRQPHGRWRSLRTARLAGRFVPFGPYLALGIGIVLLRWNDVANWLLSISA
ncbi:MAG: prepilin peptidase [Planctomycetota bacterium]|nr:prepilin peptidase [Planctomycetota bacterium]